MPKDLIAILIFVGFVYISLRLIIWILSGIGSLFSSPAPKGTPINISQRRQEAEEQYLRSQIKLNKSVAKVKASMYKLKMKEFLLKKERCSCCGAPAHEAICDYCGAYNLKDMEKS